MDARIKKIKAIAKDVYAELGSGHPEVIYDKAMQVGLRLAKIRYESQKVVELKYKEHYVGEGYPDLIVDFDNQKLAVELKAVQGTVGTPEERQLEKYMQILGIKHGLLINFQQPGRRATESQVEIKDLKL